FVSDVGDEQRYGPIVAWRDILYPSVPQSVPWFGPRRLPLHRRRALVLALVTIIGAERQLSVPPKQPVVLNASRSAEIRCESERRAVSQTRGLGIANL